MPIHSLNAIVISAIFSMVCCLGVAKPCLAQTEPAAERYYDIRYNLDLREQPAKVSMTIKNNSARLRSLDFAADDPRFNDFQASKGLSLVGDRFTYEVPARGGTLNWTATLTNQRDKQGYDARRTRNWALFRAEDAFPAMVSRALKDSAARATLSVQLPKGWSLQTPFEKQKGVYLVDNPRRLFDRPTGWMVAGKIGTRINRLDGRTIVVSAPRGENARRQDILAFGNWIIPELVRVLPDYPPRILIVLAGDPFWRGGLSGPASVFVHADRPLISENGTSTLAHELFHIGFSRPADENADWIVEGLAEYYATELLRRSGTTTEVRYKRTLDQLGDWASSADSIRTSRSTGAVTAKATLIFHALNKEISTATNNKQTLDNVVAVLAQRSGPLHETELNEVVADLLGRESKVLAAIAN